MIVGIGVGIVARVVCVSVGSVSYVIVVVATCGLLLLRWWLCW